MKPMRPIRLALFCALLFNVSHAHLAWAPPLQHNPINVKLLRA